jgi:hypothetical protein
MLVSWAIAVSLIRDATLTDVIFFYIVSPVVTAPLPLMVFYNIPRRFPTFYQLFLTFSIWSWAYVTFPFSFLSPNSLPLRSPFVICGLRFLGAYLSFVLFYEGATGCSLLSYVAIMAVDHTSDAVTGI